jgi:hypothetical protein
LDIYRGAGYIHAGRRLARLGVRGVVAGQLDCGFCIGAVVCACGRALVADVGFALVFIAALFAGGMLAFVIRKLVAAVGLRPVDRVLGAAFGVLRGVVVVLVFAVVVSMTAMHSSIWWTESTGADVATVALKGLKPVLPEEFGKYLP